MPISILAKNQTQTLEAGPILKWAGGKSQLLPAIREHYPKTLTTGRISQYIEPFVGGGSVFFDIANMGWVDKAFLFDVNPEIVCLYNSVKCKVRQVIEELGRLEENYLSLNDDARKDFYYDIRTRYNKDAKRQYDLVLRKPVNPARAALTVFLNRTCFNGLYRVNGQGYFNVPMGSYKNPTILFEEKLRSASNALSIAEISMADFEQVGELDTDDKTFIYYDPPYRPISQTSQFTSYASDDFDDNDQKRLAKMYKSIHKRRSLQMLSNSDPCNYTNDPFFDNLYKGFYISRVPATRRINSNSEKRGVVNELIITNYKTRQQK